MALSQDWKENARTWQTRYPTAEMQAEYFLLKFVKNGVDRQAVYDLMKQFKTFDRRTQGELEENEAMQLLEARNQTKTFHELRQMVADIDLDQNRKLSFLEWACAIFSQSWSQLHAPSIDPEELAAAAALEAQKAELLAKASAERDAKAQAELAAMQYKEQADWTQAQKDQAKREHEERVAAWHREQKERKEREEAERQAALSKAGVKGVAAKFHYAAADTKDTTMDNAARLKAEAAARKKARELEAEKKLADELAEKARIEAERIAEEKAIADREAAEREAEFAAAEAARREVEKGTEITRQQQAAYEAEKAEAERIAREKKAAEDADRAARRAKMAERGNLWNNPTPSPTKGS